MAEPGLDGWSDGLFSEPADVFDDVDVPPHGRQVRLVALGGEGGSRLGEGLIGGPSDPSEHLRMRTAAANQIIASVFGRPEDGVVIVLQILRAYTRRDEPSG